MSHIHIYREVLAIKIQRLRAALSNQPVSASCSDPIFNQPIVGFSSTYPQGFIQVAIFLQSLGATNRLYMNGAMVVM